MAAETEFFYLFCVFYEQESERVGHNYFLDDKL